MKSKMIKIGIMALSATLLAACQSTPDRTEQPTQNGVCQRDAAKTLVGKQRVTDEQAKQATGATQVRQIGPGQPVTMDYRQERVTIETDPATGKIIRAMCG